MSFIHEFFYDFHIQLITTLLVFVVIPLLKFIIKKIILRYNASAQTSDLRSTMMLKYLSISMNILAFILLITIWGVNPKNIFLAFSSVFAIIGVAFFAQWSLLSNITAGVIIYFTTPFKIGDNIKILDKDFPIEASIEDIKAFYMFLRTAEGELIIYPNNLALQKGIQVINK